MTNASSPHQDAFEAQTVSFDFRDQRPQDELKNQFWTINLDNQKTKACDWIYPRYAEYESSFCMRSSVYQPPSTSSSLERCVSLMRKICFWNSSSRDRKIKSKSITVKIHELILWLKFPFHHPWPSPVSGKWSCFQTHAFWAHEPTPKRACLCRQSSIPGGYPGTRSTGQFPFSSTAAWVSYRVHAASAPALRCAFPTYQHTNFR